MEDKKILQHLMKIFYSNVEEAEKDHFRILFPEQLVLNIFGASIQLLSDLCILAVPDNSDSSELEALLKSEDAYELKLSPVEDK